MKKATGSIFKRNGSWAYRVQPQEGTKRATYSRSGFKTKAEAQAALRRLLTEIEEGRVVRAEGTVAEFLEWWLETYTRSGKIKHSTAVAYRDHVRRHLVPRLGHVQLSRLTAAHVAQTYGDLLTSGEVRHKSGRGLSPKTVRNIHQTLNKALKDGVKYGLVPTNVAANVDLPRVEANEIQAWSDVELAQFFRDAAERGDYLLPIWYLLATTPLRRGEVCGLTWSDVDLVDGLLTVRRTRLEVQGEVYEDSPKSSRSRRTLALDGTAVVYLAQLKNAQEAAKESLGGWTTDLVVCDLDGHAIAPESLTRRFYAASRRAGVPQIRLHSMRHTWASLALHNGVSVHVVSARLGHADPGFTLRTYSPFMPRQDREAVETVRGKLAELLEGGIPLKETTDDL